MTRSQVYVLGYIWWPSNVLCAQTYDLTPYDIENMEWTGAITRESVEDWIDRNAGDFSRVVDFAANIAWGDETVRIYWLDAVSENRFLDITYGNEET